MATIQIKKAQRAQSKLRIGLSGPSGSGKTYSALLMARGMASSWDKVLLIDSENGSGQIYSDLGAYSVITLEAPFTPESYVKAIEAAEDAGVEVIVIDSTSHEWDGKGGCLEINENLGISKFKGNNWAAWSETTPRHQKFIEAIVGSECHVITTQRSKTDTIQTEDKKIKKVGLKDIQREGFEYELTVNLNIDRERHLAIASKDRTGLFIDRDPFLVTEKTGQEILAWNMAGAPAETGMTRAQKVVHEKKAKILNQLKALNRPAASADECAASVLALADLELVDANFDEIIGRLAIRISEAREALLAASNV